VVENNNNIAFKTSNNKETLLLSFFLSFNKSIEQNNAQVMSPYIRLKDNLFHYVTIQVFFSSLLLLVLLLFFICFFSGIYAALRLLYVRCWDRKKNTMCFIFTLTFHRPTAWRRERITKNNFGSQHDVYARSATCFIKIKKNKKKRREKKVAVGTHIYSYIYKRVPIQRKT